MAKIPLWKLTLLTVETGYSGLSFNNMPADALATLGAAGMVLSVWERQYVRLPHCEVERTPIFDTISEYTINKF